MNYDLAKGISESGEEKRKTTSYIECVEDILDYRILLPYSLHSQDTMLIHLDSLIRCSLEQGEKGTVQEKEKAAVVYSMVETE